MARLEGLEPSAGRLGASPACRAWPRRAGGSRVRRPAAITAL